MARSESVGRSQVRPSEIKGTADGTSLDGARTRPATARLAHNPARTLQALPLSAVYFSRALV